MVITSKQNPVVKELASLKEKKGRRERGTFLVEGDKMVLECMESGMEIVRLALLATNERLALAGASPFKERLDPAAIVFLGEDAFKAVSDEKTPQGIVAEVKIPQWALKPPDESCILLDGVSDPANVGAIVRTAAAAGYRKIYLADCADPYSPKSVRASMSGIFYTELMRGTREEILGLLGGICMVVADMGGTDVFSCAPPEKFCLCIGNEGNGLSESVRKRADLTVGIPMENMESLNAAVSAGILMYELKNHRK